MSAQQDWVDEIHRVDVGGVGIHVSVHRPKGRARGAVVPLVALHGGPGIDGSGLRLMLSPLADIADVVIPDQRGHGRSDLRVPAEWNLDTWADDLAAVIDALDLRRSVVMGVSFGGWVAIRHTARHPEQTLGLVIAAMTARLPTVEAVARRMGSLGGVEAERAWLRAHEEPGVQTESEMQRLCIPLLARREPSPALARVRAQQRHTPEVNAHFSPQFDLLDLNADLAAVTCPVLLIDGILDPFCTPEVLTEMAQALPQGAEVVVLPDTSHDLLVDAPEALLREIRRFVRSLVR